MISLSKRKLGRDLQKLAEVKHLQKLALKKKHHLVDGGHQLHFCPKLNFCLKLSEELKIEVGDQSLFFPCLVSLVLCLSLQYPLFNILCLSPASIKCPNISPHTFIVVSCFSSVLVQCPSPSAFNLLFFVFLLFVSLFFWFGIRDRHPSAESSITA